MNVSDVERTSRINNINLSSLSPISNVNWEVIPHKGMTRPTEQEFDVIINDLAKALADARSNKDSAEYNRLSLIKEKAYAQYVSIVSPDRKTLVKDASQVINRANNNSRNKNREEPKTLIDYLNIRDGIVKPSTEGRFSITLNTGTTVVFTGSDLQPNTFELKSGEFGSSVMRYNPNGWSWTATPKERVLGSQFLNRINSLEEQYYYGYKGSKTVTGGDSFSTQAGNRPPVSAINILI